MFGSPTAFLLWSILACIFQVFLIHHLWNYDRFKCLRWRGGQQPATFKRIMTYSYLGTVPLLLVFSVALTVIKFQEGYIIIPGGDVMPTPLVLWESQHQRWILPLFFLLSGAWGLELVTHLEELAFWIFLLHQGPHKRDWFHSWEYRAWCIGSIVATSGMLSTAIVSREQTETCISYIFLVGASAGTFTTLSFLYVLARFPSFLLHVRSEGADPDVVVRLSTFYQLNCVRIIFRFFFTLPLVLLAVDGLRAPYPVVGDPFAIDFLLIVSAFGCFTSSAITLLIFFPRSVTYEAAYHAKVRSFQTSTMPGNSAPPNYYSYTHTPSRITSARRTPEIYMDSFRFPHTSDLDSSRSHHYSESPSQWRDSVGSNESAGYETAAGSIGMPAAPTPPKIFGSTPMLPSLACGVIWEPEGDSASSLRRRHSDSCFHNRRWRFLAYANVQSHEEGRGHLSTSLLHPYVLNYRSPIDLVDGYTEHGD